MEQLFSAMALVCLAFAPVHGGEIPLPTSPPMLAKEPAEDEHLYASPTGLDGIGRIAAPVMINGQGPFRFILDTGANQSVLTRRVAEAVGIVLNADSQLMLHGVTGSLAVQAVALDSLQAGDLV